MDHLPVLLSMKDVCQRTSLSRTAINNMRSKGRFPPPVYLGERRIAFVAAEVDQWIADRIASRGEKSE